MAHPIENILSTAMENLKAMIDVDTVVGKPVVTADGVTVIPISKVSFGFASGGGEYSAGAADKPCRRVMLDGRPEGGETPLPFAGGAGAGVTITPMAFVVIRGESVRMLPIAEPASTSVDRIVEMVPDILDRVEALLRKPQDKNSTDA